MVPFTNSAGGGVCRLIGSEMLVIEVARLRSKLGGQGASCTETAACRVDGFAERPRVRFDWVSVLEKTGASVLAGLCCRGPLEKS